MSYIHSYTEKDKFINVLVTSPSYEVTFYSGSSYINNRRYEGSDITTGTVNLYELNVDRTAHNQSRIHPFLTRDGSYRRPGSVSESDFLSASYGTILTGAYPLTASVVREYVDEYSDALSFQDNAINRRRIHSLRNCLDSHRIESNYFSYDQYYATAAVNLVSIPSILFGSGIQKGTVKLRYYFTGTLVGEATDSRKNGELISTINETSGSVIGTVLYDEGFLLITSSANLTDQPTNVDDYDGDGSLEQVSWKYFGAYEPAGTLEVTPSASLYQLEFVGTQKIPTLMMFSTVSPGDLNNSQNPTWINSTHQGWQTSSYFGLDSFRESRELPIKNTIQSQYCDYEDTFEKQTFVSSIGIFDHNKNLLGVVNNAKPISKKEGDQFTFKYRVDM